VVKQFDGNGEPIRGDREIIPQEADTIRRIFREFASGKSPKAIAVDLNRDGVPGPLGRGTCNNSLHVRVRPTDLKRRRQRLRSTISFWSILIFQRRVLTADHRDIPRRCIVDYLTIACDYGDIHVAGCSNDKAVTRVGV
jgi:Recombinase